MLKGKNSDLSLFYEKKGYALSGKYAPRRAAGAARCATTPGCWGGRLARAAVSCRWTRVVRVNTLGMKHAAGRCSRRRRVASVVGVMGGMRPHAYTASKHVYG